MGHCSLGTFQSGVRGRGGDKGGVTQNIQEQWAGFGMTDNSTGEYSFREKP